ncbi:MAG: 6-phosphofructokinase [Methanocella sp. PtaU1.Bin125]|nr:MAG: 6-phosphofructokinase [Methanocella sp. PtaU1.Bin125]
MKKIGVVTSGGDAPGMNAAIRAVVRLAYARGLQVIGFRHGWGGLISNDFLSLTPRSVSGIVQAGGTMLHTCRCPEIMMEEGLRKAAGHIAENKLDGLVVIGGDGSFRAASALSRYTGARMIGVPATIDNDVFGTDETIGFDTAVNTAVSDIDKIRDTATSLDRIFIVEVMGRKRGFIACMVGLSSGAEIILVPEVPFDHEALYRSIRENVAAGKKSGIIVAAEGIGDTGRLARDIEANTGVETRLSIIGYAQRGGNPSARSRYLAALFGEKAVELLARDDSNAVVGLRDGHIIRISLEEACRADKPLDLEALRLAGQLAR